MSPKPARSSAALACALALALSLSLSAAAQDRQIGKLSDILPRASDYLSLPAAERDRFALVYTVRPKEPGTTLRFWVQEGTTRTPVPVSAAGELDFNVLAPLLARDPPLWTDLPKGGAALNMTLRPTLALSQDIPAADIAKAMQQANKAIDRAAGAAALLAPKMKAVEFTFPAATTAPTGTLILSDGKEKPLRPGKGKDAANTLRVPASDLRKAKAVRFSATPTQARFSTE
jgi:hypothetical protein